LKKFHDGISERLGLFIFQFVSFLISIVVAFVYGWELTLVVLGCMPFLIASTAIVAKVGNRFF
jgi:ATP-binding cassette, subfamily B (MDR/TAP), member 1